ncbi:MAG: hypothetical protein C4547_13350 [Phycisphaerales bacterium]|nr:MAG: hypothetical protein C4547_13350 [Phycisphaerales bacterium]
MDASYRAEAPRGLKPVARCLRKAAARCSRGIAHPALGVVVFLLGVGPAQVCQGQNSSIGRRHEREAAQTAPKIESREAPAPPGHAGLERYSLIAVRPPAPRTFKIHDHVTIIVRQQKTFEADGSLDSKREWEIKSQLDAFFKPITGGLGASQFTRGHPNIDFQIEQETKNEADASRQDRLIARLTGEILDVKPNGNLVIWAKARIEHDEEVSVMTLTGTCSKEKITADGSVLSTDVADLNITVKNQGAVRDGSSRGWIPRVLDALRPF